MAWLPTLVGALLVLAVLSPLAWKWQLGITRVALFAVAVSLACGVLVSWLGVSSNPWLQGALVAVVAISAAFVGLAYRFYRDPERDIPDEDDVIVSPADGEIVYVRESVGGALPVSSKRGTPYTLQELTKTPLEAQEAIVVGIAMNFLDVHVNRAPVAGRVALLRHVPGLFGSLRDPQMVFENERTTTIITSGGIDVAVVQIASRLVRQISAFVREGDDVALGQRIGVIRLGSQVDLVLPVVNGLKVLAKPGEHVTAGASIVARWKPPLEASG
ncbi:MAG: phosphatidylserine decarboxylase family protein [Chloroflexi bacterium]|nr:phosphatidylserine decarboxylase family protein [Chloroflexota bacterium]